MRTAIAGAATQRRGSWSTRRSRRPGINLSVNPYVLEHLTDLQRRASPITHVDKSVEEAKEVLSESWIHRLTLFRKDLDERRHPRGQHVSAPSDRRALALLHYLSTEISENTWRKVG